MTQFAASMDAVSANQAVVMGAEVTYRAKDATGAVTSTETLEGVTVSYRPDQVDEDLDGRIYSRAIDVTIPRSERASVAEHDTVEVDGVQWPIATIDEGPSAFVCLCIRHVRAETTGGEYRRDRRARRGGSL